MRLATWAVVAACAAALLPATAHAQAPLSADFTATDISTTNHQWYVTGTTTTTAPVAQHGTVTFNYPTGTTRHDVAFDGPRPAECTPALSAAGFTPTAGPARAPWNASCRFDAPGTYTFFCQIHTTMRGAIVVSAADSGGPVTGSVPDVLAIGIGASTDLGHFLLGIAADYTASLPATITSTMANATLTVHDPSAQAPGHLVNGTYVMAQRLQVKAGDGAFMPLSSPVTLLTWNGPTSNNVVTIGFKQPIAATDPLRSGVYAKTLTFTLSSTGA